MKTSEALGRVWRWLRWVLLGVLILFIAYVAYGMTLVAQKHKDDAAVAVIHAQHITLADVNGVNLPPVPNQTENDATIAGIDKNNNGIRDDVELAIFKKYPGQANVKIRAAELQYAMTEQMFLTHVFDTATWKAVAEEDGRSAACVLLAKGDRKFIENLVFNTKLRTEAQDQAFTFTTTVGSAPGTCDVTL